LRNRSKQTPLWHIPREKYGNTNLLVGYVVARNAQQPGDFHYEDILLQHGKSGTRYVVLLICRRGMVSPRSDSIRPRAFACANPNLERDPGKRIIVVTTALRAVSIFLNRKPAAIQQAQKYSIRGQRLI
jgi:hypothetical protein